MLVKYVGKDIDEKKNDLGGRNIGRHNWVKTGQIINITPEEWATIQADEETAKNFQVQAEKAAAK